MFDSLFVVKKAKRTIKRGRKTLSKRQKVLNLLSKGESVTWKALRNRFDLTSPRALVDTLRSEGNMIYINKTANGTSYRMGVPTKAIIAAGIKKLYGTPYAYNNA
jgi:predicted HTH transcriptional regulator